MWSLLVHMFIGLVDMVVSAVVGLLSMIPVPDFMKFGMQTLFYSLDPGIAYLLVASGIPTALALIGSAYGFRLIRKVVTLFQW